MFVIKFNFLLNFVATYKRLATGINNKIKA